MDSNPQKGTMTGTPDTTVTNSEELTIIQEQKQMTLEEDIGNPDELKARIQERKEKLKRADIVVIMVGCDDGRVDAPEELVTVTIDGQAKKVAMIYLPQIGGGVPAEAHLRGVIAELEKIGAGRDKIQVWLSQHGSTVEFFNDGSEKETCGARGEVGKIENDKPEWWSNLKKFIADNRISSYSGFSNSSERAGFEAINKTLNELAEANHVPPRLLFLLAKTMGSSEIRGNAEFVNTVVTAYPSLSGIPVENVYFDQNEFVVSPIDVANASFEPVTLSFEAGHEMYYQNPSTIVLLVGSEMVTLGAGVVLSQSVGGQGIDNDFTASALGESDEELKEAVFDALAQQMYAVVHHLDAKGHTADDKKHSFENLKAFRVLCSSQSDADIVSEVISSSEFNNFYALHLQEANLRIELIVVDTEAGSFQAN